MSLQDNLQELYTLDRQVRGLQGRLDAAKQRHQRLLRRLEQLQQQQQELAEQTKQVQASANGLDHQSQASEQRIAKLREQMNSVTSNKEYSALLVEVGTLKDEKSKLEDEALEQMGRADELKVELEQLDARIVEQQKLVDGADLEVKNCVDEVGEQLESLMVQRDEAATHIPADVYATFRRAADDYDGQAMAEVIEQNRKRNEYLCGGCFRIVPLQMINSLMMHPDKMAGCTNCGRILYLNKELKASFAR